MKGVSTRCRQIDSLPRRVLRRRSRARAVRHQVYRRRRPIPHCLHSGPTTLPGVVPPLTAVRCRPGPRRRRNAADWKRQLVGPRPAQRRRARPAGHGPPPGVDAARRSRRTPTSSTASSRRGPAKRVLVGWSMGSRSRSCRRRAIPSYAGLADGGMAAPAALGRTATCARPGGPAVRHAPLLPRHADGRQREADGAGEDRSARLYRDLPAGRRSTAGRCSRRSRVPTLSSTV
jgi:hypothetical protein